MSRAWNQVNNTRLAAGAAAAALGRDVLFTGSIGHGLHLSIHGPLLKEHGGNAWAKVQLGVPHDGFKSAQLKVLWGQLQLQQHRQRERHTSYLHILHKQLCVCERERGSVLYSIGLRFFLSSVVVGICFGLDSCHIRLILYMWHLLQLLLFHDLLNGTGSTHHQSIRWKSSPQWRKALISCIGHQHTNWASVVTLTFCVNCIFATSATFSASIIKNSSNNNNNNIDWQARTSFSKTKQANTTTGWYYSTTKCTTNIMVIRHDYGETVTNLKLWFIHENNNAHKFADQLQLSFSPFLLPFQSPAASGQLLEALFSLLPWELVEGKTHKEMSSKIIKKNQFGHHNNCVSKHPVAL